MGTVAHIFEKASVPAISVEMETLTKKCSRCRELKSLDDFPKEKRNRTGHGNYCKSCKSVLTGAYHKERRATDWAFRLLGNARTSTSGGGNRKSQIRTRPEWAKMNLTVEYLRELYNMQDGKCAYFNISLLLDGGMGLRSITLDRLDCDRGYVQGNVVLASRAANLARGNASTDDMHVLVEMIKRS
jgi:hypothetical protein